MFVSGDWYTGKVSWVNRTLIKPTKWQYRVLRLLGTAGIWYAMWKISFGLLSSRPRVDGVLQRDETLEMISTLLLCAPMLLGAAWIAYHVSKYNVTFRFKDRRFSKGDVGFDLVFIPQVVNCVNHARPDVAVLIDAFLLGVRKLGSHPSRRDWLLEQKFEGDLQLMRDRLQEIARRENCNCTPELMSHFDESVKKRRQALREILSGQKKMSMEMLNDLNERYEYQSQKLKPSVPA